jgi:hypothetical protein
VSVDSAKPETEGLPLSKTLRAFSYCWFSSLRAVSGITFGFALAAIRIVG